MNKQTIRRQLLSWYASHRRRLPWRETSDPYAIWVSEVMLQQTTVAAVQSYFLKFTRLWPTVEALAAAVGEWWLVVVALVAGLKTLWPLLGAALAGYVVAWPVAFVVAKRMR